MHNHKDVREGLATFTSTAWNFHWKSLYIRSVTSSSNRDVFLCALNSRLNAIHSLQLVIYHRWWPMHHVYFEGKQEELHWRYPLGIVVGQELMNKLLQVNYVALSTNTGEK